MSTPMEVDPPAPAAASSKAAAANKDKPRFEVKKAFTPQPLYLISLQWNAVALWAWGLQPHPVHRHCQLTD